MVAYGGGILPSKKSSFFLKRRADSRARQVNLIGPRATHLVEIDGDTYVPKEVSPIETK
jgi:hypothetical protein